jgi:hypothetical protein
MGQRPKDWDLAPSQNKYVLALKYMRPVGIWPNLGLEKATKRSHLVNEKPNSKK